MYYYSMILLSVMMFGGCFAIKDIYRNLRKVSEIRMTIESIFIGSLTGVIVLFLINGFNFELTYFTFFMALLSAINSFCFTFCSFKALGHINLSLFSLFSMLGGMLLPFLQGIIFYGEPITISKIICVMLIILSLFVTIPKKEEKSGTFYYFGIFILNGLSGIISNIFSESTLPKTSAGDFSICITLINILISGIILLTLTRKNNNEKIDIKAGIICGASGILDKVANFLLVFALLHVEASIQYPMVTGGVIIVSTLVCCLTERKPTKREILAVLLAFIGLVILFVGKI